MQAVLTVNRIKNKDISALSFKAFFILFWTQNTIFGYVVQVLRRIPVISILVEPIYEAIIPVCLLLLAAASLRYLLKYINYRDIAFYIACVFAVLLSMAIYTKNAVFIGEQWYRILVVAVPMYFIGIGFNFENLKKDLFWWSLLGVVCAFLYRFYYVASGKPLVEDNMNAAYNVLPSILYLFYWAFINKKLIYWVMSFAGLFLCFMFGTRGPILVCAIFFMCAFIFKLIWAKSAPLKIAVAVIAFIAVCILLSDGVLLSAARYFSKLFEKLGVSTRIFDFFIEGEIVNSTGRDTLAELVMSAISRNPVCGYGVMGDWTITGDIYVHNIFLEMWCQFGVIIGTVLLMLVIGIPVYMMFKVLWRKDEFLFVLMLFCLVFVKLMLSGTYLTETYFFLLLGISVGYLRKNRLCGSMRCG